VIDTLSSIFTVINPPHSVVFMLLSFLFRRFKPQLLFDLAQKKRTTDETTPQKNKNIVGMSAFKEMHSANRSSQFLLSWHYLILSFSSISLFPVVRVVSNRLETDYGNLRNELERRQYTIDKNNDKRQKQLTARACSGKSYSPKELLEMPRTTGRTTVWTCYRDCGGLL
jgi:hypothetical protein